MSLCQEMLFFYPLLIYFPFDQRCWWKLSKMSSFWVYGYSVWCSYLRSRNEESSNWMEGEIALHSLSVSSDKARIGSWWPHVTILQRLDLNTKVLAASLQSEEEKDLQPNDIILTTFRYGIVYLRPRHDWYFSCGAMTLFWFRAAHLYKAYQMLAQCCGTIYHIHRTANWFLQKSRTFPSSIGLIDLP